MDYITGLWALLLLASVATAYCIYREETKPRQSATYLSYRLYKTQRQAERAMALWKLLAAIGALLAAVCAITYFAVL